MAKFRNVGGTHTTADGKEIKNGEVFDADPGIQKIFPNKFERVQEYVAAPAEDGTPAPAKPTEGVVEEEDVTADFPTATEHGLTVRHGKAGFAIFDDGDPVTEKALKTKAAVEKELKKYLAE